MLDMIAAWVIGMPSEASAAFATAAAGRELGLGSQRCRPRRRKRPVPEPPGPPGLKKSAPMRWAGSVARCLITASSMVEPGSPVQRHLCGRAVETALTGIGAGLPGERRDGATAEAEAGPARRREEGREAGGRHRCHRDQPPATASEARADGELRIFRLELSPLPVGEVEQWPVHCV